MLAFLLLVVGVISRVIVHIPNFTPVIAIALFGGVYLKKNQAFWLPLVLLGISDVIIGFHETMFFTWGSILLISVLGMWLKDNKNALTVFSTSLWASILFFVVTNLGVWLVSGLYPLTMQGFKDCFLLAIPFFRYEALSTLIYATVFFGAYELIALKVKKTRLAHVL